MPLRFKSTFTKLLCWGCLLGLVFLSPTTALAGGAPADPKAPAYLGFFPPPLAKGELPVTLVPHPLAISKIIPVSFGVPFPPGYVSDPKNIALFDDTGKEMPIRVTVLARWQPPVPGAPSLRAVLVQYLDLMATRLPRTYKLRWGTPRQQTETKKWPADQSWFWVTDKSYPRFKAKDPPVWATLPASWLCQSLVKGRLAPAGKYADFEWLEVGRQGFYKQAINRLLTDELMKRWKGQVQKYRVNYAEHYEPWLYDRTTTIFIQYLTTGQLEPLAYGLRDAQYYAANVESDGRFALFPKNRPLDVKYGNQEAMTLGWFLSGLPLFQQASAKLQKLLDAWNPNYSGSKTFWTERHLAYHMMIAISAYEMTGDPALLERARRAFTIAYKMQTEPPPGAPRDGCMVHTANQHSERLKGWVCSPWMSALFVDAALRYYIVSADPRVPESIIMLADYVRKVGTFKPPQGKNDKQPYITPIYLATSHTQMKAYIQSDRQHALDISKILAAAIYFTRKQGKSATRFDWLFKELCITAQLFIPKKPKSGFPVAQSKSVWTLPAFALKPRRKYAWWFRTTADVPWLMHAN
ncbi:MAG: hypothetical protein K9K66_13640 [Desulfarculaceae bacterium]|nr:hypothetical protein [Desulfarculaceae bacterium]MCF8074007.1 hypothetical protein [Desulfarculaceae bacterium]MCF8102693.1 hypothetical protein [Desulfarculaceae bacterium]MCF8116066.1 hypothetical protein [Desulfarculaceae bacterium]